MELLDKSSSITSGYDTWYLMDSRYNEMNGLMFCDRVPLEIKSYIDDNTDANVWAGRSRWMAAPVCWRAMACCAAGLGSSIAES